MFRLLFAFSLLLSSAVYASVVKEVKHDALILRGLDLALQQKFDSALVLFEGLKKSEPDNPAGYYFTASTLAARFYDKNDTSSLGRFFTLCDSVLAKTEDSRLPLDRFYRGAAMGFMSVIQSKQGNWIKSALLGRKAASLFNDLIEEGNRSGDALGMLGSYHYWSAAVLQKFYWLPFIDDNREQGIQEIEAGLKSARYLGFALRNSLLWIYYDHGKYHDALDLCDTLLSVYPEHRIFRQARMHILFKLGRFEEAKALADVLLPLYRGYEEVPVNHTVILSKTAMIHYALGNTAKGDALADSILNRPLGDYLENRLKRDLTYLRKQRNREQ